MSVEYRPVSITKDVVTQQVGNEWLVYDGSSGRAARLNAAAAEVWKACDGQRTVAQIARELSGVGVPAVSTDVVWLALEQLEREGLVAPAGPAVTAPQISRRQLAKRMGAAALLVLPMVMAMNVTLSAQGTVPSACLQCLNLPQGDASGCGVCAAVSGLCVNGNSCNAGGTPVTTTCTGCATQAFGGGGSNNAWTAALPV